MTNNIASAWRSFWHTMTSNDRHASHDSAYRTGKHLPLSQSRHGPYGNQATMATESQTDLASVPNSAVNGTFSPSIRSPPPYSPGARTQMLRRGSSDTNTHAQNVPEPGEIQMQNFEEGLPPPPPVSHSWKRIDRWAEDNFPELYDQLGEGATQNDINELEHELDCSLPIEVRESIACHDGQERGGRPTGILFGCMLLDCEEIVQEWRNWRIVNEEFLAGPTGIFIDMSSSKGVGPGPSSSAAAASASTAHASNGAGPNPLWRQELLERQDSQPPRAIQKAYANAGWIPLARDWGGNCIAVDLAPGPAGKWGQVIIFGRDYDCKYVIGRSWSAFLAQVADDFGSGKAEVEEDAEWDGKLKLKLFKNVDPPYLEIMRWRSDQKYGRRFKKNGKGPGPGAAGPNRRGSSYGSPYGSPVSERGRSPQRFPATGVSSPRANPARINSPLAMVTEEGKIVKPTPMNPATRPNVAKIDVSSKSEKLIEAPTPAIASKENMENSLAQAMDGSVIDRPLDEDVVEEQGKKGKNTEKVGLGVGGLEEDLKTVSI